jgi:3-oxoacyl-[acyl-carrier protein] reductase
MTERKFGRVINITSPMVKQPHSALSLSIAARIGLTGFSKAIATEYVGSSLMSINVW